MCAPVFCCHADLWEGVAAAQRLAALAFLRCCLLLDAAAALLQQRMTEVTRVFVFEIWGAEFVGIFFRLACAILCGIFGGGGHVI